MRFEKRTGLRMCYVCGHDKYFFKNRKCSRCHAPQMIIQKYKNKNGSIRDKVIKK